MREWADMRFAKLAILLLAFTAVTGLGLSFHYRPTVETAYLDLVDLREASGLGFLRDLHLWASHAAIVLVWLHLLRGALRSRHLEAKGSRWTFGVLLLVLTLLLAATGSLLPWDQGAYWGLAGIVSPTATEGPDDSALLTAYALHCFVLPIAALALVIAWRRGGRRP